jgi:hypothetical protein
MENRNSGGEPILGTVYSYRSTPAYATAGPATSAPVFVSGDGSGGITVGTGTVTLKTPMSRAEATALAKKHATASGHAYSREAAFRPHDWVVDAILEAANG